jgi:hypothetical protein
MSAIRPIPATVLHALTARAALAALLALQAAVCTPAAAMVVRKGTAPTTPPAASGAATPAAATAVREGLTLIEGQVTAVDRARHTVTIAGREVEWHATGTQVFRAEGGRAGLDALRPGTRVRFALEPGSGEGRKIVLVYVEAQR